MATCSNGYPPTCAARVARGELAYAWIDIGGQPSLVVGGLAPGGGPAFYFVRDVAPIDAAIDQLRTVLAHRQRGARG